MTNSWSLKIVQFHFLRKRVSLYGEIQLWKWRNFLAYGMKLQKSCHTGVLDKGKRGFWGRNKGHYDRCRQRNVC